MVLLKASIQATPDRLRPILMPTVALVAGTLPLTLSAPPDSVTNRSIFVLVVGGRSFCLLLAVLAVPVFYSLFEDAKESRVWGYVGGRFGSFTGGIGRRVSDAYASATSSFRRRPRPTPTPGAVSRRTRRKEGYTDPAAGD